MNLQNRYLFSAFFLIIFSSVTGQVSAAQTAPNFTIQTSTKNVTLEDFRGKVVYVDFWASWCAPCRKSFPWLNQMQEKYASKGLIVIGVNVDKERALATAFLEKTPAKFYMVYDPAGELATKYKLVGMPGSYLIDRQGKIQHNHIGFRPSKKAKYESAIQTLLNH